MTFTGWMQVHRRSVLMLLALLVVGGIAALFTLPVALFPQVQFPRIVVSLDAGDRPAERMTAEVTMPVEEAVRAVPGLRSLRSTSSRGSSEISVNFDWGADMISALLQVESAISRTLPTLPSGTTFEARRMDPTVFPSIAYTLTSDRASLTRLREIAYYQLRPLLSAIPGVATVAVLGGREAEYRVTIEPAQLQAHGLTLDDVARALSAANTISAVGRIEENDKLYLAVADNQARDAATLGATVLAKTAAGGLLRVRDLGAVELGVAPAWTRVTADGHDAVIVQVYQQPDGNTVQLARDVRTKLREYRGQLPRGVKLANWYDQSELILASAGSVRDAVCIGVLLAAVVLFLFLRNGRITLIAVGCVPATLAATVLLLKLLHGSFNIMTLGGMAAAVGLIIDDAIVMVEHIVRRLRGGAGQHAGRVWGAAAEFTRPLIGSSLSTIIVFAPLAFLSGVTGAFFKALSLTMAASLVISFFVAWLAVPILADHFLGEKDATQEEGGRLTRRIHEGYAALMERVLARPVLVLLGIVPLLLAAWLCYRQIGSGFMPTMDEGGFILDYRAASGTSLDETDRLLRQVEAILQATPEVQTYSRRTGRQLGGGLTEANEGDFFVRLKPPPRRAADEVMDEVRQQVERHVPGLEIEMAQLMEDLIGDLTAVPQPIEIKLYAGDGELLAATAPKVADAIGAVSGVVDVKSGIVLAGDALTIQVDPARAALEGMDAATVTQAIEALMSGVVAANPVEDGAKLIPVRAWIPARARRSAAAIARLQLRAPDGHYFPVRRVAHLVPVTGQPQIVRDDLRRMIPVTGRISGRDLGSTMREVRAALAQPGLLPRGVSFEMGGTYAEQQTAFGGLVAVFGAALALVFLLLLFLYESFRTAAAMLGATLLSVSAVAIGLWITRTELNISSMMGLTMIVGIATEVAIFYVSELVELSDDLPWGEALVQAGRNRMRPIAMTTFAAVLALLPLALGLGAGAAMQQPLAIAIISGLLLQLPVVLIVLPVLLFWRPRAAERTRSGGRSGGGRPGSE